MRKNEKAKAVGSCSTGVTTSSEITGESPTTLYGYPAKEAKYSEDDGGFVLRVIHVNDRPRNSPARLVVILTGGTGMKDADKQKFLDSVKIGKGK